MSGFVLPDRVFIYGKPVDMRKSFVSAADRPARVRTALSNSRLAVIVKTAK